MRPVPPIVTHLACVTCLALALSASGLAPALAQGAGSARASEIAEQVARFKRYDDYAQKNAETALAATEGRLCINEFDMMQAIITDNQRLSTLNSESTELSKYASSMPAAEVARIANGLRTLSGRLSKEIDRLTGMKKCGLTVKPTAPGIPPPHLDGETHVVDRVEDFDDEHDGFERDLERTRGFTCLKPGESAEAWIERLLSNLYALNQMLADLQADPVTNTDNYARMWRLLDGRRNETMYELRRLDSLGPCPLPPLTAPYTGFPIIPGGPPFPAAVGATTGGAPTGTATPGTPAVPPAGDPYGETGGLEHVLGASTIDKHVVEPTIDLPKPNKPGKEDESDDTPAAPN